MDKDPLMFEVMADAQAKRNKERREALIAASPWMKNFFATYDKEDE